jgi:hypothetical protein
LEALHAPRELEASLAHEADVAAGLALAADDVAQRAVGEAHDLAAGGYAKCVIIFFNL